MRPGNPKLNLEISRPPVETEALVLKRACGRITYPKGAVRIHHPQVMDSIDGVDGEFCAVGHFRSAGLDIQSVLNLFHETIQVNHKLRRPILRKLKNPN
jgi:hypothetical protein